MFSAKRLMKYSPIPQEKQDDEISLGESSSSNEQTAFIGQTISHKTTRKRKLINTILIVLGICLFSISHATLFFVGTWWRPELARQCLEYTSMWSPVLEKMDPEFHLVQFNGTLGHKTEYTGDPSPEVDAVWDKWGYVHYASLSDEVFDKLPESTDSSRFTEEYGGGYVGFLEVSHQVHCLNVLRKAVYSDYYMSPAHVTGVFADDPIVISMHIKHCIETLRQNIMCNADVGVITHHWVKNDPDPFANFNTWHKCRDISSIEKWIDEQRVPDPPKGESYPVPPGSTIFERPP